MRYFLIIFLFACSKSFVPESPKVIQSGEVKVLYIQDEENPLVQATLYIPGGSLWEQKPGVTELMGALLATGGVKGLSPQEFERRQKELAADISSAFGEEYGTISFSCLADDFKEVYPLFISVVTNPTFDPDRFELLKRQSLDAIRRRKDKPDSIAKITFNSVLYKDSIYGRSLSSKDLENIVIDDLWNSYTGLISKDDALMVVTGNLDTDELREFLDQLESQWTNVKPKHLPIPPVSEPKDGIYFVQVDSKQASVFVGEFSLPRGHEDRFKVEVLNSILGFGGFGSRLMQSIRAKAGLAYSVYGGTIPGLTVGTNIIGFQTKNESVGEALKLAFMEVNRLKSEPVDQVELKRNQDSLINSFVFKFETPETTLARKAAQNMLRVPESFDSMYAKLVPQVTSEDVLEMANKWWSPESSVIVVVGNDSALSSIRSTFPDLPIFEGRFDEVFYLK